MRRTLRKRYGHAKSLSDRYAHRVLRELEAMYFSSETSGDLHWRATTGVAIAKEKAAAFYRNHRLEFDKAFEAGESATKAARRIGGKHGIFHFRGR